jgi:hypothetical protein
MENKKNICEECKYILSCNEEHSYQDCNFSPLDQLGVSVDTTEQIKQLQDLYVNLQLQLDVANRKLDYIEKECKKVHHVNRFDELSRKILHVIFNKINV